VDSVRHWYDSEIFENKNIDRLALGTLAKIRTFAPGKAKGK